MGVCPKRPLDFQFGEKVLARLQPPITDHVVKLFNFYLNYSRGDASDIVSCNNSVGYRGRRRTLTLFHLFESLNVELEEISPCWEIILTH
jgi:hypothetical protein